jgi:exodeoxyribonuclease V
VLSGYAGTGKTTIARQIGYMFPKAAFCAYTGKAAHVLREKGVPNSQTIHSLLYKLQGKDKKGNPVFSLKNEGQGLVIIDEYSMLDKALINDILSRCRRVLFLGDPAQLPPIKDGKIQLESNYMLTEIHRQALDNPILKWAHKIREGETPQKLWRMVTLRLSKNTMLRLI